MSEDPPILTLVAANTDAKLLRAEAERKEQRALEHLSRALRRCAANFMRVCRGAGDPSRIAQDCEEVSDSVDAYHREVGQWPLSEKVGHILRLSRDDPPRLTTHDVTNAAVKEIVRGSLQVAASELLDQVTHERKGRSDLIEGIRPIHEIWNANDKESAATLRMYRASEKKAAKRTPAVKRKKRPAIDL